MNARKVLLVEDSYDIVLLTTEYLTLKGDYSLDSAYAIAEARQALARQQYDVVLLDYRLPDGDGLQALEMMAELGVDTPAIIITGQGDERTAVESVKAGAAEYLVKTSDYIRTLPEVIERVIEQHQLRRAVAEAEARHRYLFDQASDGILVCDPEGQLLDANRTACLWLQSTRDELIGRHLADFERPDHTSSAALQAQLAREGVLVYESAYRRPDDTQFLAEVSAQRVRQNDKTFHQYFIRDITRRKQMEAEILRRSRELASLSEVTAAINRSLELDEVLAAALDGLLAALENDGGAIYLRDSGHLTLAAQRGLSDDFVANLAELPLSVWHEQTQSLRPDLIRARIEADGLSAHLVMPLHARETWLGLLLLGDRRRKAFSGDEANFVRVTCDRIAAAIENARLLSELQESILATRTAQTQLVQAARLSAVGELAAGVAHQINNPLTTVIADAQLLLKSIGQTHPGYPSADAIYQAGWRAQRVVQRLLNFARPDEEARGPTQVNDTIIAALDLVGAYLERSGVNLEIALAPNLPLVSASGHQLEELWINLLLNARDALDSDRPGLVRLLSRQSPEEKTVEVEVGDNGAGIPSDVLAHIFEPFYTTKTGNGGTGLGLSVCQTIVQHHGGTLRAESHRGAGTTFTVCLPLGAEG